MILTPKEVNKKLNPSFDEQVEKWCQEINRVLLRSYDKNMLVPRGCDMNVVLAAAKEAIKVGWKYEIQDYTNFKQYNGYDYILHFYE